MLGQLDARVFLISLQGRLEWSLKTSGLCQVGHLASREEMTSLGGGGGAIARQRDGGWSWYESQRCLLVVPLLYLDLVY